MTWTVDELLGPKTPEAAPEDAGTALAVLVDEALHRKIDRASVAVTPVTYEMGSISTGALARVHGRDLDGEHWSIFVKVVQHPRHWPLLHVLPEALVAELLELFPWRAELCAWEQPFAGMLPDGMRVPALYRVADLGDDRLALWMEDVHASSEVWNLARYARAARLLGRLNARGARPEVMAQAPLPPGFGTRKFAESIPSRGLHALRDDGVWAHPWLADHAGLRADLLALAERIPAVLDRLDALPQSMGHGDACPQNLLVPADAPETFVVIDAQFQSATAVGADLAQLLVGMVHAGEHRVDELPAVQSVIGDAYLTGLSDEGVVEDADEVTLGFLGNLLIRSGFTSLPYQLLDRVDDPVAAGAFAERVALTRYIAEQTRDVF